jgi:hypothetical protein
MSKLLNKYITILNTGILTERQIMDLRSVLAGSKGKLSDTDKHHLRDQFYNLMPEDGYKITEDQTSKGREFLNKYTFTSKGTIRTPASRRLGTREVEAIKDIQYFTLTELYNLSSHNAYTVPIYTVWTSNGHGFDYYYNGQVNVIG